MAEVFGLDIGELPEGWRPLEALVIVRCVALDEEGGAGAQKLAFRHTPGLPSWEALGILTGYAADLKQQFLGTLMGEDD